MAGIVESDLKNHRVFAIWSEAGIQFRSNIVTEIGGIIPLHSHSYDHVALCISGDFTMIVDNQLSTVRPGAKVFIGKEKQHTFVLTDGAPGEVLCVWPCHKE
jgi:quercetin dioxygenase-like cupin family protein